MTKSWRVSITRCVSTLVVLLALGWLAPPAFTAPVPVSESPAWEAEPAAAASLQRRRRRRRRRRRGQRNPTPQRIREIQTALVREGYLEGKPSGVWDEATVDATRRYQEDNAFPVTGKPEARTLAKLGLGSETAGVGAPRPRPSPIGGDAGQESSSAGTGGGAKD